MEHHFDQLRHHLAALGAQDYKALHNLVSYQRNWPNIIDFLAKINQSLRQLQMALRQYIDTVIATQRSLTLSGVDSHTVEAGQPEGGWI